MNKNIKNYLLGGGLLLGIVFVFGIIVFIVNVAKNTSKNFTITSTSPANEAINIYPGEIQISFTTEETINSQEDYSIIIVPQIKYGSKLISTFPTKTVAYQALGELEKNTTYTVTVTNNYTRKSTTWSFKTSNTEPESSSALFQEEQEQLKVDFYPLFDLIPYETERFKIIYTDRLQLLVTIKSSSKQQVEEEVLEWIRSHGVDPATHTINYESL